MVRTNQGGSVLGFVIIGGVLALLLIGGVYFARQQSEATSDRGISPTPAENQPREEQSAPNEETPPANENSSTEENAGNSQSQNETLPGGGASTSELPQTGPAETLVAILILAMLAGISASYVRSRRVLRSL